MKVPIIVSDLKGLIQWPFPPGEINIMIHWLLANSHSAGGLAEMTGGRGGGGGGGVWDEDHEVQMSNTCWKCVSYCVHVQDRVGVSVIYHNNSYSNSFFHILSSPMFVK